MIIKMDSEVARGKFPHGWHRTFYTLWLGAFITGMGYSMTMLQYKHKKQNRMCLLLNGTCGFCFSHRPLNFICQLFGTVFKVHRIIMIPASAPYKTVLFKNTDKFKRYTVLV